MKILAFFAFSGLGAALRYFLCLWLDRPHFPFGILVVNGLGSFLFGCLLALGLSLKWGEEYNTLFLTAFLGSMTTFASFSAAAIQLLERSQYFSLMIHVSANNLLAITLCGVGYFFINRVIG